MTKTRLIKLDEGIGLLANYLENFSSPEGNPQLTRHLVVNS